MYLCKCILAHPTPVQHIHAHRFPWPRLASRLTFHYEPTTRPTFSRLQPADGKLLHKLYRPWTQIYYTRAHSNTYEYTCTLLSLVSALSVYTRSARVCGICVNVHVDARKARIIVRAYVRRGQTQQRRTKERTDNDEFDR